MTEEIKQPENINELLVIHNVEKINSIEEIGKLYDYEKLINNNIVETFPANKNNTIIIFDTDNFNSSYVIDRYNAFESSNDFDVLKYVEIDSEKETIIGQINNVKSNTQVKYCDNFEIFNTLFSKFYNHLDLTEVIPTILIISHDKNEIFIEKETFIPITIETFMKLYLSVSDKPELLK